VVYILNPSAFARFFPYQPSEQQRPFIMEVDKSDINAIGTGRSDLWFASEGVSGNGTPTTINYFVESKEEVAALAHGLGIAHDLSMHTEAEYIGRKADYEDMLGD
jgi:hypothetical protein